MSVRILSGDCRQTLRSLPSCSVQTCVTSPPYFGLRDYGCDGQIGLELTPDAFVAELVAVFREVRRVLRDDGTLWLNLGDSYAGSGRGGNPTPDRSTLQGSQDGQRAGMVNRSRDYVSAAQRDKCPEVVGPRFGGGLKQKDLIGIPWMVAFALRADGWYLRQDIIWSKPNPMPESVRDRCTKAHEYLFLLSKSPRYFYDAEAIREPLAEASVARLSQPGLSAQGGSDRVPGKTNGRMKAVARKLPNGWSNSLNYHAADPRYQKREDGYDPDVLASTSRNKRSVWEVATQPFKEAHFATFPPALIEPCILAGSKEGDSVLDPFGGAGTTGLVADRLRREAILCELNPAYADIARVRITGDSPLFADVDG